MPALSINNVAVTGGQANLLNSNGVSFGQNGSSLTASVSIPQATMSQWPQQFMGYRNVTAAGQQSVAMLSPKIVYSPMPLAQPVSMNVGLMPYYLSSAGAASAVTSFTAGTTFAVGLYSLTGTTLTTISTAAWALTVSYSNASVTAGTFHSGGATSTTSFSHQTLADALVGGYHFAKFTQFAGVLAPGNYWVGVYCAQTSAGVNLWNAHTFPFQSTNDVVGASWPNLGTGTATIQTMGSITANASGSIANTRGSTVLTAPVINEFQAVYFKVTM